MDSRFMACSNVGNGVPELWVVVSEPDGVPEQEEWNNELQNAGAAVWLMTRAALKQFGEDDGRAYTPIMKLFGRAAIPTTTYEGVKSVIERKMKAGEISQPWEIFENLLGETYGARGRKAD